MVAGAPSSVIRASDGLRPLLHPPRLSNINCRDYAFKLGGSLSHAF